MKSFRIIAAVVVLLIAATACATASPTPLSPFFSKAFSAIGAVSEVKPLVNSAYNYNNTFAGTITSSVWSLLDGDYLYLYQAANSGPSALEFLGVAPFYGIKEVGCITSGMPDGYVSGGLNPLQLPPGSGNYLVSYDESASNVTFTFLGYFGGSVPAGQHTTTLYLISSKSPVAGSLYAMDGGVGSASGWTSSVPEPASLAVLGMGLSMLLIRRRRR